MSKLGQSSAATIAETPTQRLARESALAPVVREEQEAVGVEEAPAAQPVQLTMFDSMEPMPDTPEVTSNDNLEGTPEVNVRTVEEGADLFGEQEYKESTTTGPLVVTPEQRAEGVVPRGQEEGRVDLWDYRNNYFNRSE